MVRTAQDAPVLYGEFASQSSLYETDDMPCEFGILVRWGKFVDIGLLVSDFSGCDV